MSLHTDGYVVLGSSSNELMELADFYGDRITTDIHKKSYNQILKERDCYLSYLKIAEEDTRRLTEECEYLKRKLHIHKPPKEHLYKAIEILYKTNPGSISCSICRDNIGTNDLQLTNCGHIYCKMCFKKNASKSDYCAMCRTACYGVL
tara:strand:- start:10 stop:453 length:444 start_codon:yes stop_codon:yes gene_type:complete